LLLADAQIDHLGDRVLAEPDAAEPAEDATDESASSDEPVAVENGAAS